MSKKILLSILLGIVGAAGCGESVPENDKPADGSNARVSGTPEERIKNIQNDPSLTPAEKEMRVKAVKERNNLP